MVGSGVPVNPTVSVIIPSYNHAAFVGETIQSVLDQSRVDFEIVVTDDGSRDETVDVIRRFSDPRIHLEVFPENRGAAIAANACLKRARGQFVCMLSSDDYFLPGKLEKQVRYLEANPEVGAVFGLPRLIDERGADLPRGYREMGNFEAPFEEGLVSRAQWLHRFFVSGNCLCHPTAMVRRALIEEIGGFDPRLANLVDLDLWLRLCAVRDIHVMREELTAMRILDGNRNMSAVRRDSRLRGAIETYLILQRYRRLPRILLDEIFAAEIAAHPAWASLSAEMLLVEVASLTGHAYHALLAIDVMLEEATRTGNYLRLYALTGSIDPFRVDCGRARRRLRLDLDAARTDNARMLEVLAEVERDLRKIATPSRLQRFVRRLGGLQASVDRLGTLVSGALKEKARPPK